MTLLFDARILWVLAQMAVRHSRQTTFPGVSGQFTDAESSRGVVLERQ